MYQGAPTIFLSSLFWNRCITAMLVNGVTAKNSASHHVTQTAPRPHDQSQLEAVILWLLTAETWISYQEVPRESLADRVALENVLV
jgi:hypothetical protein